MKIASSEILLTGQWKIVQGRVVADDTCQRIDELIGAHLKMLGRDPSGWETFYRDPDDGRFWELTYPQGHLQGGGPPQLRCLTLEEAKVKYGMLLRKISGDVGDA